MSKKSLALIQLIVCSVLWSTAGILIKHIPWNPFVIAGMRSLIAAATVFIFLKLSNRKFTVSKNSVLCGLALFGTFSSFVCANKLTTSANAIVLQSSAPIFIIIISSIMFKEIFSKNDVFAVILTMLGITLFFFDELDTKHLFGNIVAIFAGITLALYYVFQNKRTREEKMGALLTGHLITAAFGIIMCFFFPPKITFSSVSYLILLGVFQLGIPYLLVALASGKVSPLTCSLIGMIEPLLNPVWVFFLDGEAPGMFALIGGAFVILVISAWMIISNKEEKAKKTIGESENL